MRHLFRAKFLPFAVVSLAIASAAPPLLAESPQATLITVTEGKNCVVKETTILCADLLKHLREVLKLPAGSRVRVRAEKASTYESTAKVFELLQKSEYKAPMGYVNVAETPEE
jgi:biopolymer transport protein ExbD